MQLVDLASSFVNLQNTIEEFERSKLETDEEKEDYKCDGTQRVTIEVPAQQKVVTDEWEDKRSWYRKLLSPVKLPQKTKTTITTFNVIRSFEVEKMFYDSTKKTVVIKGKQDA